MSGAYEGDRILQEYLLFHYGAPEQVLPYDFGPKEGLGFPQRCVSEGVDRGRLNENSRALDVGCAVGRASFELSSFCSEVIGIDFSKNFIAAANKLKESGTIQFQAVEEGEIVSTHGFELPADYQPERLSFEVGDAENLRGDLGTFDIVLAANLICRLHNPEKFLARVPELLKPGGQLILATPFTWLEEFTAKDKWLGGTGNTRGFETLQQILSPNFELLKTSDLPFLIREHSRKFQWGVSQLSSWLRH